MRHSISVEGFAFRLRPIADDDAAFVLQLRSDSNLNEFLHPSSGRLADQLDWFQAYYQRPGDYYFVLERQSTSEREGLVAIYDIDEHQGIGEWGRWILRPGSLGAVECAWLIYTAAFGEIGLAELYCRPVADNRSVVSFHESCGLGAGKRLKGHFTLGSRVFDSIEHRIDRALWAERSPRLKKLAQITARKIRG